MVANSLEMDPGSIDAHPWAGVGDLGGLGGGRVGGLWIIKQVRVWFKSLLVLTLGGGGQKQM